MRIFDQAALIVRFMSVGKQFPNCYHIGRGARTVTFVSQQVRALNLIWALHELQELDGKKVAVIGGGLAGLTAAVAADKCGAKVFLFEEHPHLMHRQRGCHSRYVHPNVLNWPASHSIKGETNLPILNWGSGSAAHVSGAILQQWEALKEGITEFTGHRIANVAFDGTQIVLSTQFKQFDPKFDLLVSAIGFGIEIDDSNVPFLSYWHNDTLAQPVINQVIPRKYFVSGCGDGGLIDVARLTVLDFDQRTFTEQFLSLAIPSRFLDKLTEIDKNASLLNVPSENRAVRWAPTFGPFS